MIAYMRGQGEGRQGWEKGERGGRKERCGRKEKYGGRKVEKKLGREEIKKKRGRREKGSGIMESRATERRRGVGEVYPISSPHTKCRFRDSFCLFGITTTHHTPVI
jgi:hypothetical protein